jgi:hypothetical protein
MAFWSSPDVEKLKAKRDTKGLIRVLDSQKDATLRRSVVEALGQTGDSQAIGKLDALLQDQDENILIRLEAIDSLVEIGGPQVIDPLIGGMRLDHPHLSNIAYRALATHGFRPVFHGIVLAKLILYHDFGDPWGFPSREWRSFFKPECRFARSEHKYMLLAPDYRLQVTSFQRKGLTNAFLRLLRVWGSPGHDVVEEMKEILKPHAKAQAVSSARGASRDSRLQGSILRDYHRLLDMHDATRGMKTKHYLQALRQFAEIV